MPRIIVSDLQPTGSDLFQDSESFLDDLSDIDTTSIHGGLGFGYEQFLMFSIKVLQYSLYGLAITNIVSLVEGFSTGGFNGGLPGSPRDSGVNSGGGNPNCGCGDSGETATQSLPLMMF
jgi:hypothetical protein